MRNYLRKSVSFTSLAISIAALVPSGADAQTAPIPPEQTSVDPNGVGVGSGHIFLASPSISVGSSKGSQGAFRMSYTGGSWTHDYNMYMLIGSDETVIAGTSSDHFGSHVDAYDSATTAKGSLLQLGSSGYVYTESDGTIINFQYTPSYINGSTPTYTVALSGVVQAVATSIVKPDGEVIKLTYKTESYTTSPNAVTYNYMRLQSVNSSSGWQLKFSYAVNDISDFNSVTAYINPTDVTAINNTWDYCAPSSDTCPGFSQNWEKLHISYASSGSGAITGFRARSESC